MGAYQDIFQRVEKKYVLDEQTYNLFMEKIEPYFKPDQYPKCTVYNIYFDTPDYLMIRTSLEKPVYKEKLRLRTYGDTTDSTNSFIEIKKKYDGIVYKRRVSGAYKAAYDYLVNGGAPLDESQISREIA
jgi:SPX domain protein involved in polyphosphate accumulation